jgi:hypothetical protein
MQFKKPQAAFTTIHRTTKNVRKELKLDNDPKNANI